MFDVFYIGKKPGLFAHEREVDSIQQAQQQSRTRFCWIVNYLSDYTGWDWLWEPVPWQADQLHAWPSQWSKDSGTYLIPKDGFQTTNYRNDKLVNRSQPSEHWENFDFDFNYTWHPDPTEPPYIYQFGTQWQKTGGPRYVVPGATQLKYISDTRVNKTTVDSCWDRLDFDFDYTWHPDDTDKPYIYQFGTQWQKTGGPRYVVPGATQVKYVDFPRVDKINIDDCWDKSNSTDDTDFDYTWHPDDTDAPYIYQFGTQWQKTGGPRYVVPGATSVKYVDFVRVKKTTVDSCWQVDNQGDFVDFDYTWSPDATDAPYIYQFGTQWQKTGGPRYVVPGATSVKYVSLPRALRACVDNYWEKPESGDFGNFDYTWHPDDTDAPYIYQFGTQWQKTGGPRYVVPGATEVKYVEQVKIESRRIADRVVLIDHLDGNIDCVKAQLLTMFDTVKVVRYFDNYLDTLRRIAKTSQDARGFLWVCSSVCNYSDFDFSWHPEQWQSSMLHVFASNEQKFGDTFFMHPGTFAYRSESCELLDWYDVNYVDNMSVPRWPLPVIQHQYDTHVEAVQTQDWLGPLAVFAVDQIPDYIPTVSVWREKTKTVVPLSPGASAVVVPKTAVPYVKKQLYDYPYIDKTHMLTDIGCPMDIVFISNGESNADANWDRLIGVIENNNWPNRVVRSNGVPGRVAAYRAAAEHSQTPWFFAVFAKLAVSLDFDWSWQPDRLQQPKHYIFHAYNPVTDLTYGHMAVIAYNRRLVLENTAPGLDFTLDQEHEVVPVMSGTAYYYNSAWMCWRTAFRECIKLKHSLPDVESEYRLQAWLDNNLIGNDYGEWSRRGAADAVEYYDSVGGDFDKLRKSYDWAWLASYVFIQRGLTPDQ